MMSDRFHDVMAVSDLEAGKMHPVSIGELALVLVRDDEEVRAFEGKCPHKGAPMEQGALCRSVHGEDVLVCPWHKAVFSALDGALLEPLALDPLKRYRVEVRDGRVLVAGDALPEEKTTAFGGDERVLILGAGAAGVAAAADLRERGFAGAITLVSDEEALPYDRTALSKMTIAKDDPKASPPPLRPADFYDAQGIERVVGRIVAFDVRTRRVELEGGRDLTGDRVLIATGSRAKGLDVPGGDLRNVVTLRSRADAQGLIASVTPEENVVIVGASFIALEAASALRQRGTGVTVLSRGEVPFEKQFGREVGMRMRRLHEENGVAFLAGAKIARIDGEEQVSGVTLEDGTVLGAGLVLVGVGAEPNVGFVKGVALAEDGGVPVDAAMRVADGVYAAGDIASMAHGGGRRRIEHWRTAQAQARVAVTAMLEGDAQVLPMPWFWTQQCGKKLEYLGWQEGFDTVDVEGSVEDFDFLARLHKDGRVVGLVSAGRAAVMARAAVDFEAVAGK